VHGLTSIIIFRLTHEKIPYLLLVACTFPVTMAFYFLIEKPILNAFRIHGKKALQPNEIKIAPVP
jgi:hypothetical protein